MIEVRSLSKEFAPTRGVRVRAVDDVSFRAEPGKVYGLLGSNGAGKTTLLRMLATLLRPTGGAASINGFDMVSQAVRVRSVTGFLTTTAAASGRLTAHETISYFARLHGLAAEEVVRRSERLIADLDMTDFADRRLNTFSTGMRQKVAIACTLVHDPAVMLFDEPTLGLDVFSARTILAFIRECRERGRTIVYSTHVMSEAEKLCDRVGIMHAGRILAEGTVPELKAKTDAPDLEEAFVRIVETN